MFVHKKKNKSGKVSVQVIDKSDGKYKVVHTVGSSEQLHEVEALVRQGQQWVADRMGRVEMGYSPGNGSVEAVLEGITGLEPVGATFAMGKRCG